MINHYIFATIKRKGKSSVVRMWQDGWFPINPVKDVDIRSRARTDD